MFAIITAIIDFRKPHRPEKPATRFASTSERDNQNITGHVFLLIMCFSLQNPGCTVNNRPAKKEKKIFHVVIKNLNKGELKHGA